MDGLGVPPCQEMPNLEMRCADLPDCVDVNG